MISSPFWPNSQYSHVNEFLDFCLQAKNNLITMEKKLEDIQGKKQVLEKVLKEKNAKANNLQEEVYVLKERLANAQSTHKRELETEKQKVCFSRGCKCLGFLIWWTEKVYPTDMLILILSL